MDEIWADHNDITMLERELAAAPGCGPDAVRVAIYLRCSTPQQADTGHTLEMQPVYVRRACREKFGDRCRLIYVTDGGLSGALTFNRQGTDNRKTRSALTLLTQMMERRLIDYVAVYACDRLFRNQREWLVFKEDYLDRYGVEFFSFTEPGANTKTASGKMVLGLMMGIAEHKREQISEIVFRSLSARRDDGYLVGPPGYGWRRQNRLCLPEGQRVGIEPVEEQLKVLLRMIGWLRSGRRGLWIAQELTRQGIAAPGGGRVWHSNTVRNVMLNHQHCGMVKDSNGKLIRGAHWPARIIELEEHEELKELWKTRTASYARPHCAERHFLDASMWCSMCGEKMLVRVNPDSSRSYVCRGSDPEKGHDTYGIRIDVLEEIVVGAVEKLCASRAFRKATVEEIRCLFDQQTDGLRTIERRLKRQMERKDDVLLAVAGMLNRGEIAKREYDSRTSMLRQEIAALAAKVTDVQKRIRRRKAGRKQIEHAAAMLKRFRKLWHDLSAEEKADLSSFVVEDLSFEPEGTCVRVRLKLILSEERTVRMFRYGTGCVNDPGIDAATSAELRLAHYVLQGYEWAEIERAMDLHHEVALRYRRRVMRRTKARSLEEAAQILAPVVAKNKGKLVPRRRGRKRDERITSTEIRMLELAENGLTHRDVAVEMGVDQTRELHMREALYRKLGVTNLKDALATCRERGLITWSPLVDEPPTKDEIQILALLAQGLNQRASACALGLTRTDYRERLARIFNRYNISSVAPLLDMMKSRNWI